MKSNTRRSHRVVVAVAFALVVAALGVGSSADLSVASVPAGRAPEQMSNGEAAERAVAIVRSDRARWSLTAADVAALDVTDVVYSDHNGLTHVYVRQTIDGVGIAGAVSAVTLDKGGDLFYMGNAFVPDAASRVASATDPSLDPVDAVESAANALDLQITDDVEVVDAPTGADQQTELTDGGISTDPITAGLVFDWRDEKELALAWDVAVNETDGSNMWQIRIDAETGEELSRVNLVVHENHEHLQGLADRGAHVAAADEHGADEHGADEHGADEHGDGVDSVGGGSYRVFDAPLESPYSGGRTLVTDPADPDASPFGWHDTNGAVGAESNLTTGNNVNAYTDTDANNLPDPGSSPDGGVPLTFDFPVDLANAPSTYRPASVTNLFYWNNWLHDVLWHYGFDEVAGNFQVNNYGKGGLGNDPVLAESQDGSGVNNANFATPPDGTAPRMQMFVGNVPAPDVDGSFDNLVVAHEYGHGVSTRLTGGPSNSTCLDNDEQAGEGWSDFLGLIVTMDPSTPIPAWRGIGNYLLGNPPTNKGIRDAPYSTSMTGVVGQHDPRTYDTIKSSSGSVHRIGSVFAAMLWEMTASLVDQYGVDADLIGGSKGNSIAMQLVLDGLKLQPCSPGFVDARDAIIAADEANNNGANVCLIWTAFAKRGLGVSASQGLSTSYSDGTQAFDIPPTCRAIEISTTAMSTTAGGVVPFTVTIRNPMPVKARSANLVQIPLPAGSTVDLSGATCNPTVQSGTLRFNVPSLAGRASVTCRFDLSVGATSWSLPAVFTENFSTGLSRWTTASTNPTYNWTASAVTPRSAPQAAFASEPSVTTDQTMTLTAPISVPAGFGLSFWHRHDTESNPVTAYGGGVVEISTDNGASWVDLGPKMTQNPYNRTASVSFGNPLPGRAVFGGLSTGHPGYYETRIDLAAYAGQPVQFRFRFGSDSSVARNGWTVDDLAIDKRVEVALTATHTATGVAASSSSGPGLSVAAPQCNGRPVTVNLALGQTPTTGNDVILGTAGADTINGRGGSDTICAGWGNDTVIAGSGSEWIDGGRGIDTISYAASKKGVKVGLGATAVQKTGGSGSDQLLGFENLTGSKRNDVLTGSSGSNTIRGGKGKDVVVGGAGDDTVAGDAGNDRLDGGVGTDRMDGGKGKDTATYAAASKPVKVSLAKKKVQKTPLGRDVLVGIENLVGGKKNDVLTGSKGANVLTGGPGQDRCNGGPGKDKATSCEVVTGVP